MTHEHFIHSFQAHLTWAFCAEDWGVKTHKETQERRRFGISETEI